MWSLAGSQAIDQPIQQLCSWDVQQSDPAALGLGSSQAALCLEWAAGQSSRLGLGPWCACSRAGGRFSSLGFRKLATGFVLGKRSASRPCAWRASSRPSQQPCSWEANPASLGLSLSGGRGRPGTKSRGTRFRGFGPVGGAASLCSRCSRRFQVWAPLRGFMYGPPVR